MDGSILSTIINTSHHYDDLAAAADSIHYGIHIFKKSSFSWKFHSPYAISFFFLFSGLFFYFLSILLLLQPG